MMSNLVPGGEGPTNVELATERKSSNGKWGRTSNRYTDICQLGSMLVKHWSYYVAYCTLGHATGVTETAVLGMMQENVQNAVHIGFSKGGRWLRSHQPSCKQRNKYHYVTARIPPVTSNLSPTVWCLAWLSAAALATLPPLTQAWAGDKAGANRTKKNFPLVTGRGRWYRKSESPKSWIHRGKTITSSSWELSCIESSLASTPGQEMNHDTSTFCGKPITYSLKWKMHSVVL